MSDSKLPSHAGVDNAMSALDKAFDEYVAAVAKLVEPPTREPYLRFTRDVPWNSNTAEVEIDTNMPVDTLRYVIFANDAPRYSWYGNAADAKPVPASKKWTVTVTNDRDRVKVFNTDRTLVADSQFFLFAKPDVPSVPSTPNGARARVDDFIKRSGRGGMNLERELPQLWSQDEHNFVRQQVPMATGRSFMAWRPYDNLFHGNKPNGAWQPPPDSYIAEFVDGLVKCKRAGYATYYADCADVCEDAAYTESGMKLLLEVCRKVCEEVKRRGNELPPDFLALGPINENATSLANVHRANSILLPAMREILPQHILTYGPDYWKYWGKFIENNNFVPPADELSIADAHSYSDMDVQGWDWLGGELRRWEQRTGRRVVYGEAGAGQLQRDEQNYDVYPANLRKMIPTLAKHNIVCITWSMNRGGHWKFNWSGAEFVNGQRYNNGGNAPRLADALREVLEV